MQVILGSNKYDPKKLDIWCCGVILYIMVTGKYPFDRNVDVHAAQVATGAYLPIDPALCLSSSCIELIDSMLRPNPSDRCTLKDIKRNPWFLCGLQGDVRRMNETWWEQSPDPSQPPLCDAPRMVEEMVRRAQFVRHDERHDDEDVRLVFPAGKALHSNGWGL